MNLPDLLEHAGLTGRGGAAFSTARKLRLAHEHNARLIVNACDGEIGAHKDEFVVARHLSEVRHGASLLTSGEILYAAHRGSATLRRLRAAGLPTLEVPKRYVSSEETSLVNLSEGGLARPIFKRTPISAGGIAPDGRRLAPTLVLNAETVWRVSQIVTNGADWFRSIGTADEPGPRLITVGGDVSHPGVLEVSAGMPLATILDQAGASVDAQVVHVGGLSGGFATDPRALHWSTTSLASQGLAVGSGVIQVMDERCPWSYVLELVDYAAGESAGQCGPCMFGLPAVATDLHTVVAGGATDAVEHRLRQRLGLLPGRGACAHPTGVARFVQSAIRTFGNELDAHRSGDCIESLDHERLSRTYDDALAV